MNYQEFQDKIYVRHSGNVKLGLERMEAILAGMGEPNRKLQGIHVGGTNGKGSTCAMLEAMCRAAGQKTGLNTSPHLVDYRERIRVNGEDISESELMRVYAKWDELFMAEEASFFEITTAMAFDYFYEQQVQAAIFEVGLGGRLDGTNPFAAQVAAITSISFDHVKSLGNSLPKIAWEKAGIIKEGQDVVLGEIPSEALAVIKNRAEEKQAKLFVSGRDYKVTNIKLKENGTEFDYEDEAVTWRGLCVNLIGEHQAKNGGVAVCAFRKWMQAQGREADEITVRRALQIVSWGGRMQVMQNKPLVLIDGAHNEEGIRALVNNVKNIYSQRKIICVLAILRDKKLQEMIKAVAEVSDKLFISKNQSKRAAEIEEQVEFAEKYGADYETSYSVVSATQRALDMAEENDVVIITGSLYTIAEVLKEKNLFRR